MNKKEKKIILARIEKWYSKLPNLFFQHQKKFSAKYGWSKKATSFNDRKKLQYKVIEEKQEWGKEWESAWFHLEGEIPSDWVGKNIYADLDFSGEGLVYDQSGSPLQGITNASIWDKNFARTRVPLFKNCSVKNCIAFLIKLFFSGSLFTKIEFPLEYKLVFVIFSSSFKLLLNSPATPSNKSLF